MLVLLINFMAKDQQIADKVYALQINVKENEEQSERWFKILEIRKN